MKMNEWDDKLDAAEYALANRINALSEEIEKLKKGNVQMPEPNSDEGDEFVRKELIRAYEICETRDQLPLEYVIRMFSDPTQWKDFYEEHNLKHYHILGE